MTNGKNITAVTCSVHPAEHIICYSRFDSKFLCGKCVADRDSKNDYHTYLRHVNGSSDDPVDSEVLQGHLMALLGELNAINESSGLLISDLCPLILDEKAQPSADQPEEPKKISASEIQ